MTQEVLKLALKCAERCDDIDGMYSWTNTITAIKEALAQPEQEPVAWRVSPRYEDSDGYFDFTDSKDTADTLQKRGWTITPLYTTPPQRKPLTDEEIDQGLLRSNHALQTSVAWRDGVEWAIKQLKEKNT